MTYMHAHAVDELRRRIGPNAEPLMHAAGAGNRVALALLERRGIADALLRKCERGDLIAFVIAINGNRWQGDSFRINDTFPETITQAMVGKPLGRVVAGTLYDDLNIRHVSCDHNEIGHWIAVDAEMVDTAGMTAPGMILRCTLAWKAVKGYVAGRAWTGVGNSMTDVVAWLVTILMGIPLILSVCMAMPAHVGAIFSIVVALNIAFIARPRPHWRNRVKDYIRGHG